MNEKYSKLNTVNTLIKELKALGIEAGMTVLCHSSLKSIGFVNGGPQAVVEALMAVLSEEGTLVMPTHTAELTDPKTWEHPPVPVEWWQEIRDTMPAFDPKTTPTFEMGKIVDTFRTYPGVLRSHHPHYSFAAWGKHAGYLTENQSLDFGLSDFLEKIYRKDGHVLMLGTNYENNTSLHLAESRAGIREVIEESYPQPTEWGICKDLDWDDEHFETIGAQIEAKGIINIGNVGIGISKLMKQRELVDFATEWLKNN